jgi:hypothetical protein
MLAKHAPPTLVLAAAFCAVWPAGASARQLGVGGRVGTLGLGPEVAIDLGDRVALRGGLGLTPTEPSLTLGDIDVALDLPTWYQVGLDLYLNGAMRIGGGVLLASEDPRVGAVFTADQEIGGQVFTPQEIGKLVAIIDHREQVPYALIGFGKHTSPGTGLFVDFGVAFVGAPGFTLGTEGGTLPDDSGPLRSALDAEAAEFEQDAAWYLEYVPVFALGLRIGVG